jgi:hypothetical protein
MIDIKNAKEEIPPPRITRLLVKWRPTGNERTWYPTGSNERLVLLWQYFKISENESIVLRRAKTQEVNPLL